ncbi:MAG: PilZ domain-containing protein [Polyangiaceae bacterium]
MTETYARTHLVPGRPRIRARHHVRLQGEVVRERNFKLVGSRILDLSEAGMLVSANGPVQLGEPVLVSFMAPFSRIYIDAEAIVTRLAHGRRKEDRELGIGLQFTSIDQVSRALLRERLKVLPPPLPTRRLPRV